MTIPDSISRVELEEVIKEFTSRLYTVEGRLNLRIDRLEKRVEDGFKKIDQNFECVQKALDSIAEYTRSHGARHYELESELGLDGPR